MKTRILLAVCLVFAGACYAQSAEPVKPNGLVVLLTDYGADSVYVGMIKGAIYSKFLGAKVDTLTNSVPPFDIKTGAYMLTEACGAFPVGTTFCCVVDPGVGTDRRCIALKTKAGQFFVAPDNGLLTLIAEEYGIAELRECTNKDLFFSKGSSTTFHGRDIFGPVSAALASGTPMPEVGRVMEKMVTLEFERSRVVDGVVHGVVMREDPYGNLVTNIRETDLAALGIAKGDAVDVTIGEAHYVTGFVTTYGSVPAGDRLVLVQSSGYVECAINMSSLAKTIGEGGGAKVRMRKPK